MDRKIRVQPAEITDIDDEPSPSKNHRKPSLHFEEECMEAEEGSGAAPVDTLSYEQLWIRENLKMRICKRFVEKAARANTIIGTHDPMCQCGHAKSLHPQGRPISQLGTEDWKVDTHTTTTRTNAYGDMEFIGYGGNEHKFVRVDTNTPMKTMLELMTDVWCLEKPNLLISVTGGAKNFHMKQRQKELFRRGLMKVARSTGAWIITGGTNAGVMKHVGEAVRDYGLTTTSTKPIVAIGVATWGCIRNKEVLIDDDCLGKYPASYRTQQVGQGEVGLDPNHTHFILVDNGTQHKYGVEIPFRARMESAIANMKTNTGDDAVSVPVVLLVLEGGPNTLETAHKAVGEGTPIVIVAGSGRAAEILAYAHENYQEKEIEVTDSEGKTSIDVQVEFDPTVVAHIRSMIIDNFGDRNADRQLLTVQECLKDPDLVTVFDLKSRSEDIDKAILKALLKANKDQIIHQLLLALAWNRIDIAKSEIFTDENVISPNHLFETMQKAIMLDRVDFVDLLMDNGVSLKEFLTKKCLLQLYNSIGRNTQLYQLLQRNKQKSNSESNLIDLLDVGYLIQDLIGDFYIPKYLSDPNFTDIDVELLLYGVSAKSAQIHGIKKGLLTVARGEEDGDKKNHSFQPANTTYSKLMSDFENPFQELMLWAVLMNRQELAKLLWKGGKDAIAAALVANGMLQSLARKTDDSELAKILKTNAEEFSYLAIDVLNECYQADEKKTQNLLVRELEHWGGATCVLIAVETDNKRFISQTACQSLLNSVWMGKLSLDNNTLQLLMCVCVPPLMFMLLKFKDKKVSKKVEGKKDGAVATENMPKLQRQKTQKLLTEKMNPSFEKDVQEPPETQVIPWYKKVYKFYTAPVVIFAHNVISYLIFLSLYSYMLLVEFSRDVSAVEIVLMVWVFTIFAEEIRQMLSQYKDYENITRVIPPQSVKGRSAYNSKQQSIHMNSSKMTSTSAQQTSDIKVGSSASKTFNTKFQSYITDTWNIVDVVTIILFLCGVVLRFLPYDATLEAARVILGLNLVVFFFRILHIFSVHKELGPKLVMIGRMSIDLMYFIIILLVFVVSYSIAAHSIMYPNSTLNVDLVISVLRLGYWNLYGELFLDDIELEEPRCTYLEELYSNNTLPRCATNVGRYAGPVMMALYVLFSNILLLNLLIAMFSYTFQIIQENTDMHWFFQRYSLIYEYHARPPLAPPLIILSHFYILIKWIFNKCCKCCYRKPTSDLIKPFPPEKARELVQWENLIADAYIHRQEQKELETIDNRVLATYESIGTLLTKLDDIQDIQQSSTGGALPIPVSAPVAPSVQTSVAKMPPQLDKRMRALEDQMNQTSTALNWIMKSLKETGMGVTGNVPKLEDSNAKALEGRQPAIPEKLKEKKQRQKDKEMVSSMLDVMYELHYKSRMPFYPETQLVRFQVPDEKVKWDVPFPDYRPVTFESQSVKEHPVWADTIDLIDMTPKQREGKIIFNVFDDKNKIDRGSFEGKYSVVNGLPLNPQGRTGMIGRGCLGRYGPNHAVDPVVTRWKWDSNGKEIVKDGKKVLEFVAVQRKDSGTWALPGGMVEPGKKVYDCLFSIFREEALGRLLTNTKEKEELNNKLHQLFENGEKIHHGYADDIRNTDNAWIESVVYSYHDDDGSILHPFQLWAGEMVDAAAWLTVSSRIVLHAAHSYYLKQVAEKLNAFF